jgi:hypothetical protein
MPEIPQTAHPALPRGSGNALLRGRANRIRLARRYSEEVNSGKDWRMADTQLADLQNMRVLLQEARGLARDLAYHRRARMTGRPPPVV